MTTPRVRLHIAEDLRTDTEKRWKIISRGEREMSTDKLWTVISGIEYQLNILKDKLKNLDEETK